MERVPNVEFYCVVCKRDFAAQVNQNKKVVFFRGYCPVCNRDFKPVAKSTMKHEDAPERLIEIIQSTKVSREDREAAIIKLTENFRYLIRKQVNSVYNSYELGKRYNYDYSDFFQDGITEFLDLVINDFKVKETPTDTGLAYFGSYIKVKFYYRILYKTQERLRKQGYGKVISVDFGNAMQPMNNDLSSRQGSVDSEIREAIVANAMHYDDIVLQSITDDRISEILSEIFAISHALVIEDKVSTRDRDIWEAYYNSGLKVEEVGEKFESKISNEKIGRSRVMQVARNVNDKILTEYGRRNALKVSGIDLYPAKKKK